MKLSLGITPNQPSPDNATHVARAFLALIVTASLLLASGAASAATFFVSNTADAIPAPPGSLRAAIEESEINGEPDSIFFIIDGGTIQLVAPLPDLAEGHLRIGERRDAGDPVPSAAIIVSGGGQIARAFRIRSEGNLVGELGFEGFAGNEVILISGNEARDNVVVGCVFGGDNAVSGNAGAAVRIRGNVSGTEILLSRLIRNDAGVLIEGSGPPALQRPHTTIRNNWFGTDPLGGPGPGNGEAIHASDGGQVIIQGNRFSGPGSGITLGVGSDRSVISHNSIGLRSSTSETCSGFDGPAIQVQDSPNVRIQGNTVLCSQVGVLLGANAQEADIRDNRIGGPAPDGHRSHGIFIDSAEGGLIRRNAIRGNDGYGITSPQGPVGDPVFGTQIACNSIQANTAGALNLPGVTTLPPVLNLATPVDVEGNLPDPVPGWVEVFGDDTDQAGVFQGALTVRNVTPPFRHRLPVLGLRLAKVSSGAEISFDRSVPPNHTATLSNEQTHETTELSGPLPAEATGLVFDLIRGKLGNLSFGSNGIDLGDVVCLASGLDPEEVVSPNVVDPEIPPPGEGFFYTSRRRDALADVRGTYDPAICLADVDQFRGPRRPTSGDCP